MTHVNAFKQDVADAFAAARQKLAELEMEVGQLVAKVEEDAAAALDQTAPAPAEPVAPPAATPVAEDTNAPAGPGAKNGASSSVPESGPSTTSK